MDKECTYGLQENTLCLTVQNVQDMIQRNAKNAHNLPDFIGLIEKPILKKYGS